MADFNPQVQPSGNDQGAYFKYSEPIKNIMANESTGMALKTAGVALEGGAELADSTVKGIIKNDTYNRVDAERDSYTGFLAATKNPASAQDNSAAVGAYGPNPAPLNLMADNSQTVPGAINSGIGKIDSVQSALAGNKISETSYYQRLNSITKDLRATYPGYRDYIDTEVSKITGVNPANAYISGLIQDINRQSENKNKDKEFWTHQIVSNSGFPGSDDILAKYEATGDHAEVMKWLAFNQGAINALQLKKAAYESSNQDKASQTATASEYADKAIAHAATIGFANKAQFGGRSPSDIADFATDMTLHPEKRNDEVMQQQAAQYNAMYTQIYNQTSALLHTQTKGPDGRLLPSVADTLGPEETKKKLDAGMGVLFGQTQKFLADKQFSPAYGLQQSAEATQSNVLFQTLKNPTIGARVATASAINKLIPQLEPVLIGKLLGSGLDTDTATFIKEQGRQMIAQTGGKYFGENGQLYSFKQATEEQEQGGNLKGKPLPGQALNNLIQVTKVISDPTSEPQAKINVVKGFFDPVNKGVMDKFMDDYYDPQKRGVVKGRSSAFAELTKPELTKSIYDLNPTSWQMYSNWAKGEFSTQFRNQIGDLNQLDKESNDFSSTGLPGSQFKASWNSDTHQFILKNHDGTELDGIQATPLNSAYRTVQNLNMGLRNMSVIAKTEGSNIDAYLFKVLKDAGYSPSKEVDGVPSQLMRAMITANGGKVKINDAKAPVSQ